MRYELLVARKKAGMTQQELADRLQIKRYKYSKIESGGQKIVDVVMADSISQILGVSVAEIFLPADSQKLRTTRQKTA